MTVGPVYVPSLEVFLFIGMKDLHAPVSIRKRVPDRSSVTWKLMLGRSEAAPLVVHTQRFSWVLVLLLLEMKAEYIVCA